MDTSTPFAQPFHPLAFGASPFVTSGGNGVVLVPAAVGTTPGTYVDPRIIPNTAPAQPYVDPRTIPNTAPAQYVDPRTIPNTAPAQYADPRIIPNTAPAQPQTSALFADPLEVSSDAACYYTYD